MGPLTAYEISALPPQDFKAPRDWIDATDREEWDRRIPPWANWIF